MLIFLENKPISGVISAPASKSYLQRAIAIAALGKSTCIIENFYPSDDAKAAIRIAESLGASISIEGNRLEIVPIVFSSEDVEMNCGEAGLSTRMFSPIAAVFNRTTFVTGEGSILNRPMDMVVDALTQLGAKVASNNKHLPLQIEGPITAQEIEIDGSESSQLLTGLLIAVPLLKANSIIHVEKLKSIPYVEMTIAILKHFGVVVKHDAYFKKFEITGNQSPKANAYFVEGDWSGASFLLVAGAIGGEVTVTGLNLNSFQADRAIVEALSLAGAEISYAQDAVKVKKANLKAFEFDATNCPDLFPPLAALAACCEGTSILKGTNRLIHKESNRAITIKEEFGKLGINVKLEDNCMKISKSNVKGGRVSSRNDHRIAMATAILSTVANGPIEIEASEAVNKSYPTFFEDFKSLYSES